MGEPRLAPTNREKGAGETPPDQGKHGKIFLIINQSGSPAHPLRPLPDYLFPRQTATTIPFCFHGRKDK